MKAYLDTSALIRAWSVGVVPQGITRAHSMAEFYCVLTGPGLLTVIGGKTVKVSVSPVDGRQAAVETFAKMKFHDLSGHEALATLEFAVNAGISGRPIHDWMHAEAAALAGCDALVTLNAKDFARMVGDKIQIVGPSEFFGREEGGDTPYVPHGLMNGAGQIDEQGRGRARRKRNGVTGESRREAPALDPSHGEELLALMLPDFVDRDDVRVIEVGGGFGFQLKPIALGLAREFPRRE